MPDAALAQRSQAEGFGRMEIQSSGAKHSYARVKFPDGTQAERFVLRAGDCARSIGDCGDNRERVEFAEAKPSVRLGVEVWYAWSIFLPREFPKVSRHSYYYTFGQIHQNSPSRIKLMFRFSGDGFLMNMKDPRRLGGKPIVPAPNYRNVPIASDRAMRGRWNRVLLNAKWSVQSNGFIELWLNGRKIWSYDGPTTNAEGRLYFKYGIYRGRTDRCDGPCPVATAYFKDVRQGRTRADVE